MKAWMVGVLAAAAILTGCKGDGDEPSPRPPVVTDAAMRFSRVDVPGGSRAATALEDVHTSFLVWAYKSSASEDVMVRYQVDRVDTVWVYEGHGTSTQYLKYWDLSASDYVFAAVSPASNSAAASTLAKDRSLSVTGATGNSSTGSDTDWLIARHKRLNASVVVDTDLLDIINALTPQPVQMTSDVALRFHHILSQIEFRAYTKSGDLLLSDINIVADTALAVKGDYDEGLAATWRTTYQNWKNYTYGTAASTSLHSFAADDEIDYISVTGTSQDDAVSLGSRLEIPQPFGKSNKMNVTVTATVNGNELTGTFELSGGWNTDTRYVYYIAFDESAIILMDISAEEWGSGGDPVEDEQSNW